MTLKSSGRAGGDERTDSDLVLHMLKEAHGDWVEDLYSRAGVMVHSRVADLRRRGHRIECKRFGVKDYRYRLVDPEEGT